MAYPRVNYEMTEEELKELLDACKPTPCMKIGSYYSRTPQENANTAWQKLGEKHGFDFTTVRPVQGKGNRFFSAVPTETELQREERIKQEETEKKLRRIEHLKTEIETAQQELKKLEEK